MARPENSLKKYLVKTMGTRWDVQSHEDSLSMGIPDLSYGSGGVNGWIELKRAREYPKKNSTPIKFKHFTASQVNWLSKRGKAGGFCWIFIQVSTEYYLFPFSKGRALRAGMTKEEFREQCFQYWTGNVDPSELLSALVNVISPI